jgi:hypothetical protein
MTIQPTALNEDTNGRITSSEHGDRGDGTSTWFQYVREADGGNVALGATDDDAETDSTADASLVALTKGVLELVGAPVERSTAATTALTSSLVAKDSAGDLLGIVGYSTLDQFIQIHDASSVPADTEIPLVVIPIVADTPFSIDFGDYGLPCDVGIVVCNSTTGPTKTLGADDVFMTAIYR